MKDIKNFTLRIPKDIHIRIKTLSVKESRSLNNEILELVKRGLESEATKKLKFFN